MHRLALSMACSALVFGLATADAETPPKKAQTPSPTTSPHQGKDDNGAHKVRSSSPRAKEARAPGKRSARARLPALRERRLQALGRERGSSTAEDLLIDEIESIWSGRELRRGTTAVYVVDADTGRRLYEVHADERLNPASNVKLVATATILDILGPDWRYLTRILGPTPTPEGVIRGDLYLLGSYDPTLYSDDIEAMARNIAESGVTRIEGDIYVGEGVRGDDLRRDSVWRPRVTIRVKGGADAGDSPDIDVSPENGFVQVESRVETIKRTRKKRRARVDLAAQTIEDPELGAYWRVELTGYVQAGRSATYRRVVPDGQLFTAHLLHQALSDAGVTVTGSPRQAALPDYVARATSYLPVEIARHESAPMNELVAKINKRSINYLADRAIMTAGAIRYGGPPTMDKGVRAMHEWLRENANIDPDNVVLDTGSGLSYKTELTARQIVKVLRAASGYAAAGHQTDLLEGALTAAPDAAEAADLDRDRDLVASLDPSVAEAPLAGEPDGERLGDEPDAAMAEPLEPAAEYDDADSARHDPGSTLEQVFHESLAVGGVDGTLRGRFRRSKMRGKVIGKTGTLTRVIALSGLVHDDDGNTLAFAIITNGHKHKLRRRVRKQHDAMVEAMQRYLSARPDRAGAGR